MTITTTNRLFLYQGNGATTVFPFDFEVPDADYFSVQLQDHTSGTVLQVLTPGDYILTGVGNPAGGSVTYNPPGGPIDSDVDIVGIRTMPYTQETVFSNQGGFYPEALEEQLDFIVMQVQQLAEEQARSLIVNPGQTPPNLQDITDAVAAAQTSAAAALVSEQNADTSEGNALSSSVLAGQYANYPEDQEIPGHPGEFSGLHFRNKCQAIFNALTNTLAGWIHGATLKTPMIDADEFGYWDSVSAGLRKLTLANLVTSIFTTARTIANAQFASATFKLFNAAGTPRALTFITTALTADHSITVPDRDVDLSNEFKYGTNTSLSGTSVDILNIPAGTKRIQLIVESLSLSGTASPLFQLGKAGGPETTGYISTATSAAGPNIVTSSTFTAGIGLNSGAAANLHSGILQFDLINPATNRWVASGTFILEGSGAVIIAGGNKALAGPLDRIRITSSNGTDTFDSGTVNVIYE